MGGTSALGVSLTTATKLEDNRWYHVAVSVQQLESQNYPTWITMWLDSWYGEAPLPVSERVEGFWPSGLVRAYLPTEPIVIGRYLNTDPSWSNGQFMLGKIDEVRIWKGIRTRDLIHTSTNFWMNRTISGDEPWISTSESTLLAAYNFNDINNFAELVDVSGNKHHGQIQSGPRAVPFTYELSAVQIVSFHYMNAAAPVEIVLYGGSAQGDSVEYWVRWTSNNNLGGTLYRFEGYDADNQPIAGAAVGNGNMADGNINGVLVDTNRLVYISDPQTDGQQQFFYRTTQTPLSSEWTEVRLDVECCCGEGDVMDACGVCNGNNATLDDCGVCNGNNAAKDFCGECFGNNSCGACGPNGEVLDACGICDGHNETMDPCGECGGTGYLDYCGVCNGTNDSCCVGEVDACGVCNGNNESCMCACYHGVQVDDMQYVLLQYLIDQIQAKISQIQETLSLTKEDLENYSGSADLTAMIQFLAEFSEQYSSPYSLALDEFILELKQSVGLLPELDS